MLQNLLGASGQFLGALEHRLHQEFQDVRKDPVESQEELKVCLAMNIYVMP